MEVGNPPMPSIRNIKQLVMSEPILTHPDPTKQYMLEVDASGFALGAVLSQRGNDGKFHPISYYS